MWKNLVFALIQKLLQEWLNKEVAPKFGVPTTVAASGDLGADIQAAIAACHADTVTGAVGHAGGIVQHLQELYTAFQARDWVAIWKCVNDIVGHL